MNLNNENYKKQIIPLLIYLFISIFLVSLSTLNFFSPIYLLADGLSQGLRANLYALGNNLDSTFTFLANPQMYIEQNKELESQLHQLHALKAQNIALQNENTVLSNQLGVSLPQKPKLDLALIISKSPTLDTIVVNQGSGQGIAVNDTAIYENILIGRVVAVTANTAKILLITSQNSSVPVIIQESQVEGLLNGSLGSLSVNDILPNEQVDVGDTILTSGVGESILTGY